jgi:hypothetical protein
MRKSPDKLKALCKEKQQKIMILALERIIKSKKATGRQKDKLVLPVLSYVLTAIRRSKPSTKNTKNSPS